MKNLYSVVGDVMLDRYHIGTVDRISQEAPVPILKLSRIEDRLGGAGNVAHNLAVILDIALMYEKPEVVLYGRVGNDDAGSDITALCAKSGIADCCRIDVDHGTIVKHRFVDTHWRQVLRVDEEPIVNGSCYSISGNTDFTTRQHSLVVVSDYGKGSLTAQDRQALRELKVSVIVNCKPKHFVDYRGAVVVLNEAEARVTAKGLVRADSDPYQLCRAIGLVGLFTHVVVTHGERGISWWNSESDSIAHVPAVPVPVYDVSGAGDTVLATIAARYLEHGLTVAVLEEAAELAAQVVRQPGTAVPYTAR